jgi:SAM-dependent methyltransferase
MKLNLDPFYDELEVVMKKTFPLISEGGNVLDIGCGKGWLTRLLHNNLSGNVSGIDNDRSNIDACRLNADHLTIEYEVMDMDDLIPNTFQNSFSFITCHNVLGYLPTPAKQLLKMYSWLQPNGLLSIVVRTPSGRFAEVYERSKSIDRAIERYKDKRMVGSFGEVCELFLMDDLIEMIEEAGFLIINRQGLYSIETYLPNGHKALQDTLPGTESDQYFFQWLLCLKDINDKK